VTLKRTDRPLHAPGQKPGALFFLSRGSMPRIPLTRDQSNVPGPLLPGSNLYRLFEQVAREIVRTLDQPVGPLPQTLLTPESTDSSRRFTLPPGTK
jgi:hypothetical protein